LPGILPLRSRAAFSLWCGATIVSRGLSRTLRESPRPLTITNRQTRRIARSNHGIPIAVTTRVEWWPSLRGLAWWLLAATSVVEIAAFAPYQPRPAYHLEKPTTAAPSLRERFASSELGVLEKLNRTDVEHLAALSEVVIPNSWDAEEIAFSPLPARYPSGERFRKLLVAHLPIQAFGAYESGVLVRWGPLSSGARNSPTANGIYSLNWRSTGHTSTINPDWFMRWYFNFGNREGLAFHEYSLPGHPASHGCVRLLTRDAQWIFEWGETWALGESGRRVITPGTPVFIVGQYDFDAAPPWRLLPSLTSSVELPTLASAVPVPGTIEGPPPGRP
jgi:hypothetical protein